MPLKTFENCSEPLSQRSQNLPPFCKPCFPLQDCGSRRSRSLGPFRRWRKTGWKLCLGPPRPPPVPAWGPIRSLQTHILPGAGLWTFSQSRPPVNQAFSAAHKSHYSRTPSRWGTINKRGKFLFSPPIPPRAKLVDNYGMAAKGV